MIKSSTIHELVYAKVVAILMPHLETIGFKYSKTKKNFTRKQGIFHQLVYVHHTSYPIYFNSEAEQIFLEFNIISVIEIPEFENWYFKNMNEKIFFRGQQATIKCEVGLSFDDFKQDDFYTPTPGIVFKKNILQSLSKRSPNEQVTTLDEFINTGLNTIIQDLAQKSDPLVLFEARNHPISRTHILLLVFCGHKNLADHYLDQTYENYIELVNENSQKNDSETSRVFASFENFLMEAKILANKEYPNPFNRTVTIKDTQHDAFPFALDLIFTESRRFDISAFSVYAVHLNSFGDIFLFVDNKQVILLNFAGESILKLDIKVPEGFGQLGPISGLIEGTSDFFVNNYVIKRTGESIILPLPLPIQKTKRLPSPNIQDLGYSPLLEKYYLLYRNQLLIYTREGSLETNIEMPHGNAKKIFVQQEWVIAEETNAKLFVLNFQGQLIHTFPYNQANYRFDFSRSFQYLICFFYSTKSQFFDLKLGKQTSLWAHPTFIKGYKELMYNDIHQNYGMHLARFSPDEKYIVGGGDHGKYVAWTMPDLKRIELIPQTKLIEMLPSKVHLKFDADNKAQEVVNRPELVELDNQLFLKNRDNNLNQIFFLKNGDYFLTEIGNSEFLLAWDRHFNNLSYFRCNGKIGLHVNKYLTQLNKSELVIYE